MTIRFDIVENETTFRTLKPEWDELWDRAQGRYYQRFDVCLLAWEYVARPKNRMLRCIVVRDDHRLVLIWPLVKFRRGLWTYLMPLGPDAGDYTSMLVQDGIESTRLVKLAWGVVCSQCSVDFIHLPFVKEANALHGLAREEHHVLSKTRHDSWIARLRSERNWDKFCDSLGTMFRKRPGQLEERLRKNGEVSVHMVEQADTEHIAMCVRRMLVWKRQWSNRVGKKGDWIFSKHYEDFLISTLTYGADQPGSSALAHISVVSLNGSPIAAVIISHGNPLANAVIGGFDPAFGKFGPGSIAVQHCVQWAFEHRYDIDFGVGSERFKSYWSRENRTNAWSFKIALTTWGLLSYRIVSGLRGLLSAWRVAAPTVSDGTRHPTSE